MRRAVLALLLAVPAALAAPPKLTIPAEVKAQPGAWVTVSPETDAKSVTYVSLDGLSAFPSSELKDPRKLIVNAPLSGRFRFVAVGTLGDEQTATPFSIVVGDAPAPTPVPPGPGPSPQPPGPQPTPGMRVLILEETGQRTELPPAQVAVLFSKKVKDYLDSKTPVGPDNVTHEWRIWDKDEAATGESTFWQNAVKAARDAKPASWPAVAVFDAAGKLVACEPLPGNVDLTLEYLKKFGN